MPVQPHVPQEHAPLYRFVCERLAQDARIASERGGRLSAEEFAELARASLRAAVSQGFTPATVETLRAAAAVHRQHPDFDEAWL